MSPRPPFTITSRAAALLAEIHQRLGAWEGALGDRAPAPRLRKQNRIRTVRDTLAIEGNRLSVAQVTAIVDGAHIVGSRREILEVKNAIAAYEQAHTFDPLSEKALLRAHGIFMHGLVEDAGRWRRGGVGILAGTRVAHLAPPAKRLPALMHDLFSFLRTDRETPGIIKAAVAHYELEFIHPFSDGNGRVGRFWQHLLFRRESRFFEHLPAESLIKDRQREYYAALADSDAKGSCELFIELILTVVLDGLGQVAGDVRGARATSSDRLDHARNRLRRCWFKRKDYLELFPALSTATASRDLREASSGGDIERRGERASTEYRFVVRRDARR